MEITKIYRTETAHIVREAFSERCKYNIHGHSYVWEVTIEGDLDKAGMVIDFGNLASIKQFIDLFDHSMVMWKDENNYSEMREFFKTNVRRWIVMNENPTAENMANLLYRYASGYLKDMKLKTKCNIKCVTVHETITGRATSYNCSSKDGINEMSKEINQDFLNL